MGSEQSHQAGGGPYLSRQSSKAKAKSTEESPRSSSPRPSISSDSDIPYISYTVNRPIGDSPKLTNKRTGTSLRTTPSTSPRPSPKQRPKSFTGPTYHDIVVVKEGGQVQETLDTDPDIKRLQSIPTFLPIMRGALNIPTMRDPEVLDKLDYQGILQLCLRYQDHARQLAEAVGAEQNALATRIREIDFAISALANALTEKQKKFSKYSEQLSKVPELSSKVKKCQVMLSQLSESMEILNSLLPPEEQLEPFGLMTG